MFTNVKAPIDAKAIVADLKPLEPMLDVFRRVVTAPDYQLDAFLPSYDEDCERWPKKSSTGRGVSTYPPLPDFVMIHSMAKLVMLKRLAELGAGGTEEALSWTNVEFSASRIGAFDETIAQIIGMALQSFGANTQAWVVASTSDLALLRQALKHQQALAASLPRMVQGMPLDAIENVGKIREAVILGTTAPKFPPMTHRQLTALCYSVIVDYCKQLAFKKANGDPDLVSFVQEQEKRWSVVGNFFGGPITSWDGFKCWIQGHCYAEVGLFLIANDLKQEEDTRVCDSTAQAYEGLLQLETARRIYAFEHGAEPKSLTDLTPEPLAKLPADPFAKGGATFKLVTGGAIYSIGPDGHDDAARLAYDPTNGAVSPGDIFFKLSPALPLPAASPTSKTASLKTK